MLVIYCSLGQFLVKFIFLFFTCFFYLKYLEVDIDLHFNMLRAKINFVSIFSIMYYSLQYILICFQNANISIYKLNNRVKSTFPYLQFDLKRNNHIFPFNIRSTKIEDSITSSIFTIFWRHRKFNNKTEIDQRLLITILAYFKYKIMYKKIDKQKENIKTKFEALSKASYKYCLIYL